MKKDLLARYAAFIQKDWAITDINENTLAYWQDRLFTQMLIYFLPLSFIAVCPGVYMSFKTGSPDIGFFDIGCLLSLAFITFNNKTPILFRKCMLIGLLYAVAVFLAIKLGYMGPGIFYLFAITIITALIFPLRFAYFSVLSNAIILAAFAFVIGFDLFKTALAKQYSAGEWIAFSSNIIFLSLVIITIIDRIFSRLQFTIETSTRLQADYESIFIKNPMPMWLFDVATMYFLDVNDAAIRNYGWSKEEFLSMTIKDIRPPEDIPELVTVVRQNNITGKFHKGISKHVKKNGELMYVNIESNKIIFKQSEARLVLATDVTEMLKKDQAIQRANIKIKESENNLRAIFESTIDGFILLDAQYLVMAFNSRAKEYLKFHRDQKEYKIGTSIFEYVDHAIIKDFKAYISRAYAGEIIQYDRKFRKSNGSPYWIYFTLTPVYEGDVITGACITGRNVTEQKTYIKTIEKQNKALLEISWMQSHLVRAPLARIMGLNQLLNNATTQNEREEILKLLNISTTDLDNIIRDINNKSVSLTQEHKPYS